MAFANEIAEVLQVAKNDQPHQAEQTNLNQEVFETGMSHANVELRGQPAIEAVACQKFTAQTFVEKSPWKKTDL